MNFRDDHEFLDRFLEGVDSREHAVTAAYLTDAGFSPREAFELASVVEAVAKVTNGNIRFADDLARANNHPFPFEGFSFQIF